jgi:hypothetical protein
MPSSWDLVAATSALSKARCAVVSFMFAHDKTKTQQEIFTLDRRPILHAVDTRTSFSKARLCQNRDLELLASTFEREWAHVDGPPAEVSGDQEFAQGSFLDMLCRHNIAFREHDAR